MHHVEAGIENGTKEQLVQQHGVEHFYYFSDVGEEEGLQLREDLAIPGVEGGAS